MVYFKLRIITKNGHDKKCWESLLYSMFTIEINDENIQCHVCLLHSVHRDNSTLVKNTGDLVRQ